MRFKKKIRIILVTGFLGAGKTTLLNRLIDYYRLQKTGLIINDFGRIAVDGTLLSDRMKGEKDNSSIYEIANGSIFCSCLSAELVKGLKHYAAIKPEILIIETSGLSDPSSFGKILKDNELEKDFEILATICLIEPVKALKLASRITAIERQITGSDILLINKTDLISDGEFEKTATWINEINPHALVIKTVYAEFDFSVLKKKTTGDFEPVASCNTVKSRPGSIVLPQKDISKEVLNRFYENIKDDIFRLKGFLMIKEQPYYISDNNGKLIFESVKYEVEKFGLSVLLPIDKIEKVSNFW